MEDNTRQGSKEKYGKSFQNKEKKQQRKREMDLMGGKSLSFIH